MKTLYIDCQMGAAGDMLSAALLELTPDQDTALAELNSLGIPGVEFVRETLVKCGIAATHLSVRVHGEEEGAHHHHHHGHEHHHEHHSLADILKLVESLALGEKAKADVAKVYKAIAAAESRAHGRPVGEIHFHEVGALDAVADIAAFCHLMNRLSPDEVVVSPVNVGSGTVECAHGTLSVPAPATAFLLQGMPSYSDGEIVGELCTPTGAALLKTFASSFGTQPLMKSEAIGFGAGRKDFPRANVVRTTFGEKLAPLAADGTICELDFNVDDMTGEELAFASERIFAAGAKDVSFVHIVMKKGRPGILACVMCMEEDKAKVVSAIFANTSTLGVREKTCLRYTLTRNVEEVSLSDGSIVRRKVASGHGVSRAKWETDDLAAYARRRGISLVEAESEVGCAFAASGGGAHR